VTSFLAFVFVLGVLIFVHELGHFLMARRIGVRVVTFSLGFGPKLIGFRRGDTEYCISAVPLGGYVKMAGETPEDARTGASDEFLSKTKWQRFQVLVMGPVMNLALAIVVMALVLYQGAQVGLYEERPTEVASFAQGSPAKEAGIQIGDRIVAVDGETTDTWQKLQMVILGKANRQVVVMVDRGGKSVALPVHVGSRGKFELGEIGIFPVIRPVVRDLERGSPAQEAGLQPGDIVLSAEGERYVGWLKEAPDHRLDSEPRLVEIIRSHPNTPITLEVLRNGETKTVSVTPRSIDGTPKIGAHLSMESRTVNPGLVEAFKLSIDQNWEWATLILKTLGGLLTRHTSVKQLMGPVAIADLSGTAAEQGWLPLFSLMAMISLNLGLLNLMPIPVLDGGHIAILAMEGVSRRDFSMKVKEKMLLAGFVLLLMLMVTVIYNDLTRIPWIERLMPWR
jgi:regulator of sigma E protease